MNSYYSNRIEGQSTTPKNIDDALKHTFSSKPEVAQLQRIAVAHIEAEKALEAQEEGGRPLQAEFARSAHRALYSRLQPEDRSTKDGLVVEPGE